MGLNLGDIPTLLAANPLPRLSVEKTQLLDNVRSALDRKHLRRITKTYGAHDMVLQVIAGGPSLADTWPDVAKGGYRRRTAAVNGSLRFLLDHGVRPWACGVLDPGPHMRTIIEPVRGVTYFVASVCDPTTFDHLEGQDVVLWHPTGMDELLGMVPKGELLVSGGSTMGIRWVSLGYVLGFRRFDLHGLDSSFRGNVTHAYPDWRDGKISMMVGGRPTTLNYLHQVGDFVELLKTFNGGGKQDGLDDIAIRVRGDGLLQDVWRDIRGAKADVDELSETGRLSAGPLTRED